MGCSFCRGHAGQVCSHPDCRDETKEVEESIRRQQQEWYRMDVTMCTFCHQAPAVWRNNRGGFRCEKCPRHF